MLQSHMTVLSLQYTGAAHFVGSSYLQVKISYRHKCKSTYVQVLNKAIYTYSMALLAQYCIQYTNKISVKDFSPLYLISWCGPWHLPTPTLSLSPLSLPTYNQDIYTCGNKVSRNKVMSHIIQHVQVKFMCLSR